MPFARLPTLGRSPAKSAAAHIRQTLVRDALRDAGGNSASGSSAVLSPPSFSRYTRGASASLASLGADPELDSLMRRVSLLPQSRSQQHVSSASTASVSANPFSTPSYQTLPSTMPAPAPASTHEAASPMTPPSDAAAGVTATPESDDGSASTFSSSGEEDSLHNTAHPSAAFLLASRQRGRNDDDDNDDEEDSLDTDPDAATASFEPVHPFARAVAAGAEDDSFDSLDGDAPEETVFGARPVKRGAALPLRT